MFFFLFLVILINVLIIPVVKEKIKVKLALAIPKGAPVTVVKEIIDTQPFVAKQLKFYLCNQMKLHIDFISYCLIFFL